MSQPYVGEIRIFGGNFPPVGWTLCDGRILSIAEYETLFNLIGTTYGGDGQETFAVPDLRGRIPVHQGTLGGGPTFVIGEVAGVESVTLLTTQIPAHNHPVLAVATSSTGNPTGAFLAPSPSGTPLYQPPPATFNQAAAQSIPSSGGGNQPHDNVMPFQTVGFIISLFGIFPSPN